MCLKAKASPEEISNIFIRSRSIQYAPKSGTHYMLDDFVFDELKSASKGFKMERKIMAAGTRTEEIGGGKLKLSVEERDGMVDGSFRSLPLFRYRQTHADRMVRPAIQERLWCDVRRRVGGSLCHRMSRLCPGPALNRPCSEPRNENPIPSKEILHASSSRVPAHRLLREHDG